jgi:Bacterial Ig domain
MSPMAAVRRIGFPLVALLLALAPALIPQAVPRVFAGTNGVATDDYYFTHEDTNLTVFAPGVLANDYPSDNCVYGSDTFGLQGSIGTGVTADGKFSFVPAKDFNGDTSFTYVMGQSGFTCPLAQGDTGQVFITVIPVNDAPHVVLSPACAKTITVQENSGAFTAQHCVQMVDFGPADESNQSFDAWLVSTTHPELFSKKPTVTVVDGLFGRLRFTPAPGASGTATVSIRGRDSGGTLNLGKNTSSTVKVKVVIKALTLPTTAPPTAEPTTLPTEVPTIEPSPVVSIAPTLAPTAAPSPAAAATPAATAGPSPGNSDSSGTAVLLGALLLVLLAGFAAAVLYPRWRAGRPGAR